MTGLGHLQTLLSWICKILNILQCARNGARNLKDQGKWGTKVILRLLIIWKVSKQLHCRWGLCKGSGGARGGKEIKEGFLDLESLPIRKFQGPSGGEMMMMVTTGMMISVTLEVSTWWESVSRRMQITAQRASGCCSGKMCSRSAFPPRLYLTFGEPLPSKGHDKETGFIESQMRKH